ncbi:type VI secretion system baseplate subunit TssK [Ideonella sp. YS5]|uniref:type VI secretion system baseplate subunit TssK n=1 Tax=Ideonella sp. YS5 TaxID=3453714 RepID=UPI003EE9D671
MIRAPKLLWGEGLFLRPQHFQRQDAYHETRLADASRALHPYAWGLRQIQVDTDALATGMLRILQLRVILPDGDLYNAPSEDDLPEPVSLNGLSASESEVVFHLTVPGWRAAGSNFAGRGEPSDGVRFAQRDEVAADWFTGAAEAEVSVLRRRARLMAATEPRDNLVAMPLIRLRRQATGAFELDIRFVPPVVSLGAAPILQAMLRRLLDVLQAKVDALYGHHREPSRHVIEFRSGDIASFWLLHTTSGAFAALSHFHHHPLLHPERLFERMLELAGSLMTFSKSHRLADLPRYSHEESGPAFAKLDEVIRDLLETVISSRCFAIALQEAKPSYHHGRLDSGKIDANTRFYLGVQSSLPPSELVDSVPHRFKVGAPDDVEKLVLSAMAGVRLVHAAQVPAAIPVRPGAYYFALEPRGPLYERMLQAQSIAIYVPSGTADLNMELFALADNA